MRIGHGANQRVGQIARKTKKAPGGKPDALTANWRQRGLSLDDDVHLAVGLVELDHTVLEREKRPIAAGADVLSGADLGAALADDDVAGDDFLAAELFHTETFGRGIATVARGTCTFLCAMTCNFLG